VAATEANDDLEVTAVLNGIAGKEHGGTAQASGLLLRRLVGGRGG